jgi:hypothetical protein
MFAAHRVITNAIDTIIHCLANIIFYLYEFDNNNTMVLVAMIQQVGKVLQRREVFATLLVVPAVYFYFGDLVASLDGSLFKAALIVLFFWVAMAVDVSQHMTGQPDADHHHDHHHE